MSISEVVRLSPARISLQVQWAKQDNSPGPEIGIFYINQDLVHKVRDLSIVPYHAINSNSSGHIYVLRIPKVRPFSTETRETKGKARHHVCSPPQTLRYFHSPSRSEAQGSHRHCHRQWLHPGDRTLPFTPK